ncbi:reductive dehalogenase [Dehalogenimonas sp. WBC-2]|nr:reductive dehalogenase [Dehalogenimonas sp. WBC-2]
MSKFHSTVSRRDFMKGLGFGTAGVGAMAASVPVFHDLDEMMSSTETAPKHPWWVKSVDEPTVEIDWDVIGRYDARYTAHSEAVMGRYFGLQEWRDATAKKAPQELELIKSNTPGKDLRSAALSDASMQGLIRGGTNLKWHGPETVQKPEERGVPKYTGTPEENLQMIRAAMRYFGAHSIGAAPLDAHHKKLVSLHPQSVSGNYMTNWPPPDTVNKRIVFEDVDQGYSTTEKYAIPTKEMWACSYTTPMSKEMFRAAPSAISYAANALRYRNRGNIMPDTQNFVRGLGYQILEEPYPCIPAIASAVLTGTAENGRNSGYCLNPEFGSVNGYYDFMTDLPLEETKPIDAGLFRFCHTCRKCAEICPQGALSMDNEPTWDPPKSKISPKLTALDPSMDDPEFHQRGKKVFWKDEILCQQFVGTNPFGCIQCQGGCTFNVNSGAMVHELLHTTLSVTPLFNGIFWQLGNTFGYGLREGEDMNNFWKTELPAWGYDSSLGVHGTY